MDGFLLLESEGVDILRDNDLVLLQVRAGRRAGTAARASSHGAAEAAPAPAPALQGGAPQPC
jgi:hypothetical protein